MNRIPQKYILIASDALIPVLGFFLWDWSLYFILLFYFLDLIGREVVLHFKSHKIIETQGFPKPKDYLKTALSSAGHLMIVIAGSHMVLSFLHPQIDFFDEMQRFWNYEEWGIKQGPLLLPLIGLAVYSQYRGQFLMRGKDRVTPIVGLWKQHFLAYRIMFVGILCATPFAWVGGPEWVFILAIVASSVFFSLRYEEY